MAKDPAALLYIDKWITATTEMRADARAYYMDLILFQFDKGSIPNDIEEIANICRVRFSEFETFKQVFEQVLEQKFKQNEEGRLENEFAKEIIQKRKQFKDKRSNSGKLSYIIKCARSKYNASDQQIKELKSIINLDEIDTKNEQTFEQVFKQVFKQKGELYINEDVDENINKDIVKKESKSKKQKSPKIDPQKVIDIYNATCKKLPQVQKITDKRKKSVNARLSEYGLAKIGVAFSKVNDSKFLNGENDRTWVADFDWIMNPNNFIKIIEGRYDNRKDNRPSKYHEWSNEVKSMGQGFIDKEKHTGYSPY